MLMLGNKMSYGEVEVERGRDRDGRYGDRYEPIKSGSTAIEQSHRDHLGPSGPLFSLCVAGQQRAIDQRLLAL